MNWEKIQFKKLYLLPSKNGLNRPSSVRGKGYKMINMGEIFAHDRLKNIKMELVELSENEKKNYKIDKKDLIFARQSVVADGAGKCSIVIETSELTCFESHIIRVRLNEKVCDAMFYYYFFQSQLGKGLLSTIRQQGVQAGIRGSDLANLKVIYPPLYIQKKISNILNNFDQMIENNLKQIELLEEFGKNLYDIIWIKMKMKNYKSTNFKISDYVDIISRGASLDYDIGETVGVEVLNQSCIRNGEITLDKVLKAKELPIKKSKCYLLINDILINSMGEGTIGRVSRNLSINKKMIIHNCITFLRAKKDKSQYLLYYFILKHQKFFEIMGSGSTGQSSLKIEIIKNLKINVPKDDDLLKFNDSISKLWKKISFLKKQNLILENVKKILLPRLMLGIINMSETDK